MTTQYNADNVKNSADKLGRILDAGSMGVFNDLTAQWPDAGKFALAQWLERIVDDRRNAIVAHATHLRLAFDSMSSTLTQISKDFENTDGDNAKNIKNALDDMQGKVGNEWTQWDQNTEKAQGNYSGGSKDNAQDGDGYNDNDSVPIGQSAPDTPPPPPAPPPGNNGGGGGNVNGNSPHDDALGRPPGSDQPAYFPSAQ